MSPTEPTEVRRSMTVDATPADAFAAFVRRFGDFKPREHNLLASPIVQTVFEPRVGGTIYDRAARRLGVPLGARADLLGL